jgi:hypothetical protein
MLSPVELRLATIPIDKATPSNIDRTNVPGAHRGAFGLTRSAWSSRRPSRVICSRCDFASIGSCPRPAIGR